MRQFLVVLLTFLAFDLVAQSASEIMNDSNYIWGEGEASSLRLADDNAIADLSSQIAMHVISGTSTSVSNIQDGHNVKSKIEFEKIMKTYSSATLTNTSRLVLENEPVVKVLRFVKKSELDNIFASRIEKIKELIRVGEEAERKSLVGEAIRYYYWANMMINSLRPTDDVKWSDNGVETSAETLISQRLKNIFSNLKVKITGKQQQNNTYEAFFTYKGEPVSSLDYIYWLGNDWSYINTVCDGHGVIELKPGFTPEKLQIKYECLHIDDAQCDKEVYQVLQSVAEINYPQATAKVTLPSNVLSPEIKLSAQAETNNATQSSTTATPDVAVKNDAKQGQSSATLLTFDNLESYKKTVNEVVKSINKANYASAQSYFTPEGYELFNKLIKYGKARVVGTDHNLVFSELNNSIFCRSIPMSFTFSRNRRFTENVVFTFTPEGKIDNVSFGLSTTAQDDIFGDDKNDWTQEAKQVLISFLENYKTAYALERADYLESIFADDALIISGKVVVKYTGTKDLGYKENRYVKMTKYTKSEYIKRLRSIFGNNEFINIKFANNEVKKMGKGGEIYAIQIKQDYFSANYGDSGYLFLMVDVNEPKEPIIHVRAWQENPDSSWGILGPEHF